MMRSMSESTSRRIALLVQFDGTDFHGWQMQPNLRTVQGTLSKCLEKMTGEPVVCNASSRTDAGVHAVEQTAHIELKHKIKDKDTFLNSINFYLKKYPISITKIKTKNNKFHD